MGVEKRTTRASKVNGGKATVNKVTTKVTTNKAATSKSIVLQKRITKINKASLADNSDLDRSTAKVGVQEEKKLSITIKDSDGNSTTYDFSKRDLALWNDAKWIIALNQFRHRIFARAFPKDITSKKTGSRSLWSFAEKEYLQMQIRKVVKKTGVFLAGEDWKLIAEAHNERFAGKEVKVGEKLATGKVATTTQVIEKRSIGAMKTIYTKNQDMMDMVEQLVKDYESE